MSNLPIDQLSIVDLSRIANYAWVAGIIDGEGTIDRNQFIDRNKRIHL